MWGTFSSSKTSVCRAAPVLIWAMSLLIGRWRWFMGARLIMGLSTGCPDFDVLAGSVSPRRPARTSLPRMQCARSASMGSMRLR
eukprot:7666713-Pyramimonas_sp.AAC.1